MFIIEAAVEAIMEQLDFSHECKPTGAPESLLWVDAHACREGGECYAEVACDHAGCAGCKLSSALEMLEAGTVPVFLR